MNRIVFAASLVVLVLGVVVPAQTQSEGVEQDLINLEKEWGEAIVKGDTASIDMLMADEFICINDGTVFTKAQYFEFVKSIKKEEILSFEMDEWKVLVYGDAAVVMARSTLKMQSAGKETTSQLRFTDTWVELDGRWQVVAAHNSTIAQK